MSMPEIPTWRDDQGEAVSCSEKIKVMRQNMQELFQMTQDAFEDGLLMGCNETQLRNYLRALSDGVDNPYRK